MEDYGLMTLRPEDAYAQMGGTVPNGNLPAAKGETTISSFGSVITAQRVAVHRDLKRVLTNLKALCAMNSDKYVYSWPVKDRANNRTTIVEGPTIKLANDLVREYGNCVVDVRAFDEGDHIMFYARFTDLETGFSLTRPFQQRKLQNTGMRDVDRQRDIVFQIGASKAIRNVVVNALSTHAGWMVEEAKKNLLTWVENNVEKARKYVDTMLEKHQIAPARVEAVAGRKMKDWTVRDLTRIMTELRGIDEGLNHPDDTYPDEAAAAQVTERKNAKARLDDLAESGGKPETGKTKAAPKKKAEQPKPAAEASEGAAPQESESPAPAEEAEPHGAEPEPDVPEAEPEADPEPEPEPDVPAADDDDAGLSGMFDD